MNGIKDSVSHFCFFLHVGCILSDRPTPRTGWYHVSEIRGKGSSLLESVWKILGEFSVLWSYISNKLTLTWSGQWYCNWRSVDEMTDIWWGGGVYFPFLIKMKQCFSDKDVIQNDRLKKDFHKDHHQSFYIYFYISFNSIWTNLLIPKLIDVFFTDYIFT